MWKLLSLCFGVLCRTCVGVVAKADKTWGTALGSFARHPHKPQFIGAWLAAENHRKTLKLELHNAYNVQYFMDISVGGQALPALVDTGSWDVMVLSSLCQACKTSAKLFDSSASATFIRGDGQRITHVYGSGKVVAQQDFDTVSIGTGRDAFSAEHQPIWQMIEQHLAGGADEGDSFSAILGFGHMRPADDMPNLTERDLLLYQLRIDSFAFCIRQGKGSQSWITLNPTLPQVHSSAYRTVPVVGDGFWAVELTDVGFGANSTNPCSPSCAAIIDSGTSLMAAPPDAFHAMAPVLDKIAMDCSNIKDLPNLVFKLGGHEFSLPPSAYVAEVDQVVSAKFASKFPPRTCFAAFNKIDMRHWQFGPVWILGLPFLREYLTIFDRAGPQVHIAPVDDQCAPVGDQAKTESSGASIRSKDLSLSQPIRGKIIPTLATVSLEHLRMPPWALGAGMTYMRV